MHKTKTIHVRGPMFSGDDKPGKPTHYRVVKVTDSLDFAPGQTLVRKDVDGLCESQQWKVTITE